jgi:uncharacterized protein YyaL (SSP411 family)
MIQSEVFRAARIAQFLLSGLLRLMPHLKQLRFNLLFAAISIAFTLGPSIMNIHTPGSSFAQAQEAANETSSEKHAYTNLLINESSPYLLQHAHNPVNWYPWGDEAFAKAKLENKPVFLSIGYSTCYWCHVMEVESFEDPEVAAAINEHFIAIKVDREERPDIDEQYMIATQLLTQRGGWPNSVWLTPEGKPWMAGTYFPKKQFISVLNQLNELWTTRRADVDKQADAIANAAKEISEPSAAGETDSQLAPALLQRATQYLVGRFDSERGGFHGSPKFPPHSALRLLIQQYRDTSDKTLLEPIAQTLDAMWLGGIHDQLGGGFHRYSTDAQWLLPHFEKMLYDNAQLMGVFADAFEITGESRYRDAVADIYAWVDCEMTSPQGAFYSALDSGEVGKEGEAYVWTMQRLSETLDPAELELFTEVYHIEPNGNFTEESTGERSGANIPHRTETLEAIAQQRGVELIGLKEQLAAIRTKLLSERLTWPQPHKDDKVLTSWNGLMIGSLAHAGRLLDEPRYIESAKRAAEFIFGSMVRDGRLLRTYRDGQAKLPGYLDDYAYYTQGLVELYRATRDIRWLQQAEKFATDMIAGFEDQKNGGFFFTSNDHEELLVRSKHLGGGGNMPNPNGVAALVLVELFELTGDENYRAAARRALQSLAPMMQRQPAASDDLLLATSLLLSSGDKSAIAGAHLPDSAKPSTGQRVGPVVMSASASQSDVAESDMFTATIAIDIDDGWHLYAENPEADFLQPSSVAVAANEQFAIGQVELPQAERRMDKVLKQTLNTYTGHIEFKIPVTVKAGGPVGETSLPITVTTQACDASRCLPINTTKLIVPINIIDRTDN